MYHYLFHFRCCCRHIVHFLELIERGIHNDEECEKYRKRYKDVWGQEIDCKFKGKCDCECDCEEYCGCKIKTLFRRETIPYNPPDRCSCCSWSTSDTSSIASNGEDQKLEHFDHEDNDDVNDHDQEDQEETKSRHEDNKEDQKEATKSTKCNAISFYIQEVRK